MPLALLALAIGAFGIGTTEFVMIGLLPQAAADFGVSVPTAGLLVTGYALGVVAGAPLMTVLGTRIPRKRMLMLLMGLFIAGNLITAAAPVFAVMVIGRVVASLAHGAFFGIGSIVAADLVKPEKKAGAIAMMFTGLTVANVVGVPLGTLVGQSAGWRLTFVLVAALGVLGLLGVARLIPDMPKAEGVRLRHELAVFRNVQVLLAMGMTVLGFGGVFAAITYIAPMMTDVTGYSDGAVTWLLMLFGLGMVAGNLVGDAEVNGSAVVTPNFGYNLTPVSEQYPGISPGQYVVNAGESPMYAAMSDCRSFRVELWWNTDPWTKLS